MVFDSKGSKSLNFEWNHTQLKFKPGTVEKNEIGPPAGINLRFRDAGAMLLQMSFRGS